MPDASEDCPNEPGPAANNGCPLPQKPPDDPLAKDVTAPETVIVSGPKRRTSRRSGSFAFSSSEPGSTFTCKVDDGFPQPCGSEFKTRAARGAHVLVVFATDAAGNADSSPVVHRWKVKRR